MIKIRDDVLGVKPGATFGKRTVLGKPFSAGADSKFRTVVQCECGRVDVVFCNALIAKRKPSLVCADCAEKIIPWTTHNESHTRLYRSWHSMYKRCHLRHEKDRNSYWSRGIEVCLEWRTDFIAFKTWALDNGYSDDLQLDRIDNDAGYSPSNCRWVTRKQNARNTRRNAFFTEYGETKTLPEWAEDARCVVSYKTLTDRMRSGLWSLTEAITTPRMAAGVKRTTSKT